MAVQPESIGKYKILSVVAVGGMGTVYKAVHPSLKRQVIIKKLTLKNKGGTIRERFKREAQILLDLSSPYVVRMFDYFTEGRSDYIVLEFVDGMSLDKLIAKQVSLPPQLALLIFLDACYGLKHAHAKGIVHRDIKPGNILISRRAEVKLADFGIAGGEKESVTVADETGPSASSATTAAESGTAITMAGTTLGTPAYMSPEQLDDSSSVDQRADIYSMGVMLYEMVTGTKPFSGDMSAQSIAKIKKGDYIPPAKLDKTLPHIVRSLIKKMMKPNPARRFQTIDPVIVRIRCYLKHYDTHSVRISLAQAVIASHPFELPQYQKKKRPALRAFLILSAAALFISGSVLAWNNGIFHRTILSPWFRSITLTMEMPSTASVDADLPARAFFFVNDNKDIPEVSGTRRVFTASKDSSASKKNIEYKTRAVFLRPGEYRIKIAEGPYVWWGALTVASENRDIKLDFLKNASRKLKIHTVAFDSETSENITSKTKFMVQSGAKWIPLEKLDTSSLRTGTVYKILAVSEGYEDEYFSLLVDWYQDELFINSSLRKK